MVASWYSLSRIAFVSISVICFFASTVSVFCVREPGKGQRFFEIFLLSPPKSRGNPEKQGKYRVKGAAFKVIWTVAAKAWLFRELSRV